MRNSRSDNSDANEGGSRGGPLLVHPEHDDGASGKPDLTVEGSSTGEPRKITNEDVTDPAVASAPRGDPERLRGNFSQIRLEPAAKGLRRIPQYYIKCACWLLGQYTCCAVDRR